MAGILLTPGPVCTHTGVQSLSRMFRYSINKAKFLFAANKLQSADLGTLMVVERISKSCHVFVKKTPDDIRADLLSPKNNDLCTPDEYEQRFNLPPPAPITLKIQNSLVELGIVPAGSFKQQERKTVRASVTGRDNFPQQPAQLLAFDPHMETHGQFDTLRDSDALEQ